MQRSTASAHISALHQAKETSHSTSTDAREIYRETALHAWNAVAIDILDSNRWLESIFKSLQDAESARHKGKEVVFTELMKTPGRKRTAANLSTTTTNLAKKDSVATLLFPAAAPLSFSQRHSPAHSFVDKENANLSLTSPTRIASPVSRHAKGARGVGPSPIRSDSPRSGLGNSKRVLGAAQIGSGSAGEKKNVSSPLKPMGVEAGDVFFDDSLVLALVDVDAFDEEEEERDEAEEEEEIPDNMEQVVEEEKANLSIIGEEEEEEETSRRSLSNNQTRSSESSNNNNNDDARTSLLPPLAPTSSTNLSGTQVSNAKRSTESPAKNPTPLPTPAHSSKSPPRASTSSSTLAAIPDADADVDLDEAPPVPSKDVSLVPLNDNPSTLRNQPLSSSTSSAPTHTPGGSSSSYSATTPRFATSTYSSAKAPTTGGAGHGSGILSSSPPAASSTLYGRAGKNSMGGTTGARPQLSFVGLPKKSLGHGLGIGGLGRSLSGANSWNPATGGDSQGSQGSTAASISSVFGSQTQASTTATIAAPVVVAGTTAAAASNGGVKRKSLTGPEAPNKTARTDVYNPEDAASKARREALSSRLMGISSRPSNVARPSAFGSFAPKPLLAPSTSTAPLTAVVPSTSALSTSTVTAIPTPTPTPIEVSFPPVAAISRVPTPPLAPGAPVSSSTPNIPETTTTTNGGPVSRLTKTTTTNLARRSSVSDLVKVYERNSIRPLSPPPRPSSRLASPYSPAPGSPRRPPLPQVPNAAVGRAMSPVPVSTSAHRLALRSPPRNTATATSIPWLAGGRSPDAVAQAQVHTTTAFKPSRPSAAPVVSAIPVPASTTPKGSPQAAATARSILQQLAAASKEAEKLDQEMQIREEDEEEEEEEGDEEEEMIIREVLQGPAAAVGAAASDFVVATVSSSSPALAEKRDREAEARLASLPARLDLIQDEEFVDDEEEEEEDRDEMDGRGGKKDNGVAVVVVEKGRGALVHALDNTRDAESARSVMPGTFGGQREEEEEGEVVIVRQKQPEATSSLAKKSSVASVASSSQSQAHSSASSVLSFLGKPFGSSSTSKKPEQVKSIQLARANKKKEEQEKERRAALKEERDQKRSALVQKKQGEDREKQDDERKLKNDGADKKRKERDELATSQPASSSNPLGASATSKPKVVLKVKPKTDEEPGKKRKLGEQASEVKRPGEVKKQLAPSRPGTSMSNHGTTSSLSSSIGKNGPSNAALKTSTNGASMVGTKFMNTGHTFASGLPARVATLNPSAPKPFGSHQHQGQAFASGSGSSSQNRVPPPRVEPEPYQELPDIDSEYSDSGDEGYEDKAKALPQWAQSPALKGALDSQQYVNPDNIFGTIPPLSMQEIFRTNSTRITKRTSSACWEGPDALSQADMARYDRQMGFSKTQARPSRFSKE